jgi:hypothetical protein
MSKKISLLLPFLLSYGIAAETPKVPKLQKEFEQSKQKEQSEFYGEPNTQNSSLQTTKTSCIQQSVYAGKTLEEQKKILIEQAKQESLEELYGTLILTSTDLKNGKITNDEIKTRAVGSVRVKGDPKFYNGQNLGEICANVTSYITKEDLEKYTPREVKLKDFCFSDSSVAIKEVKNKARESAYKEMLVQFKPALKTLSKEEAEKYIHGFKESNGNFDFDKGAYCFDAVGTVLPYELEFKNKITNNIEPSEKEVLYWQAVKTNNDVVSLNTYLNKFPNGKFVEEAKQKIKNLNLEIENKYIRDVESAWNEVKDKRGEAPFVNFLNKFPASIYTDKAEMYAELYKNKIDITGEWNTNWGALNIKKTKNNEFFGNYTSDNGRLIGEFKDNIFRGVWVENNSDMKCSSKQDNSFHWGKVTLYFDENSFKSTWGYCSQPETRDGWLGTR